MLHLGQSSGDPNASKHEHLMIGAEPDKCVRSVYLAAVLPFHVLIEAVGFISDCGKRPEGHLTAGGLHEPVH